MAGTETRIRIGQKQRGQGALKILQPLNPANVRRGHPAMLASWTTEINGALRSRRQTLHWDPRLW